MESFWKCRAHVCHKHLPIAERIFLTLKDPYGCPMYKLSLTTSPIPEEAMKILNTCTECKIALLSLTPMEDLMDNTEDKHWISTIIYERLMATHPKMPKILSKAFSRNIRFFDFFCNHIQKLIITQLAKSGLHAFKKLYRHTRQDEIWFATFILSIRYWTDELFIHFQKVWIPKINRYATSSLKEKPVDDDSFIFTNIPTFIFGVFARRTGIIRKQERLHNVPYQWTPDQKRNVEALLEIRRSNRKQMSCSWCGCANKEDMNDVELMLCGGCEMAYYCSKSCQKRAWIQHRLICKKFSSLNLI